MRNQLLEPLKYYEQSGKSEQEQNARAYFERLLEKSKVDVAENKKTADEYRKQALRAQSVLKRVTSLKVWLGFLIFFTVVAFIVAVVGLSVIEGLGRVLTPIIAVLVGVACLLLIFLKIKPELKQATELYKREQAKAQELLDKANAQTAPLNSLFTERDALNLIEKTMQGIVKFTPEFSTELEDEFAKNYDFSDAINYNQSVVDTLAGRLCGNPFVFYRYKDHTMGLKSYHGTKVISYYVTVRDSDGRTRRVLRTQTLHATVSKPYPYYSYKTALNYGHQSAPDLRFSRVATDVETLTDKQVEKRVKKGQKKLQKKAEKALAQGQEFTEMTNSEFEVLFGATNRNHEVQFRMLFSPLALNNMVDLLRSPVGYGDDFNYYKSGRYNLIESEHAQRWTMHASPDNYYSYDVELIRKKFVDFNNAYFKSVFFDFAPLLSTPAYQEPPASVFEPLQGYDKNNTYYEHEAMANAVGALNFAHPSTATDVILKTKLLSSQDKTDCVEVTANSYRAEDRLDFVSVLGGDGCMHAVPVPWTEYLPVQRVSQMAVRKYGYLYSEYKQKINDAGLKNALWNTPNAYFHGLFAKIIDGDELTSINGVLDKLK